MKYHIIHHEKFNQLQELERAAANQWKRREIRNTLLDSVEFALGRKARLSKKALLVIEEIVYKASDRGYSFNGREKLAEKLGVSLATVDRALKMLKDSDEVIVCYRENPLSNGMKTPVVIFRQHPNFEQITSILELRDKEDDKVENEEKPFETRDTGSKSVTTYLPTLKHEKEMKYKNIIKYVALKVIAAEEKSPAGIMHLGSYIDKVIRMETRKAVYSSRRAKRPIQDHEVKRFPIRHFYKE